MTEPYTLLDAAYAAARWGWFLPALVVIGAASYSPYFLLPIRRLDSAFARELAKRAARLGIVASILLVLAAGIRLYIQSRTLLDPDEPASFEFIGVVLDTGWGRGWLWQAAMSLLALTAYIVAAAGVPFGWWLASAASVGIAFTAGLTGHAATPKSGTGGLILDGLHFAGGGVWLGGLAVMFLCGLSASRTLPSSARPTLVRALVANFSRRAIVAGPLTIAIGVWLAARYMGWTWPAHLLGSGYGRALGIKLIALAGVAGIGAYNWRIVQPALDESATERHLRSSAALELLIGALLLAATAVLVALPLPSEGM
ncbi:MAG: hypothetical protein HOP28_08375 [Gemmatimonadales bacterium]|nr:hypothetical protein [Gemmatimonadales bacterium]